MTDDEKTHKNPALKSDGLVKSSSESVPAKNGISNGQKQATKYPPKTELEGKRWNVEFHKNNSEINIEQTELQQSVYVYKCENSTIMVRSNNNQ